VYGVPMAVATSGRPARRHEHPSGPGPPTAPFAIAARRPACPSTWRSHAGSRSLTMRLESSTSRSDERQRLVCHIRLPASGGRRFRRADSRPEPEHPAATDDARVPSV
jgi:hypothetical protein